MLSAWCDDLLALPEEVWSAYALSREPLRGRLDREGYRPYYDRAPACGREEASRLAHAHPGASVRDMAAALGVTVEKVPMPQGVGIVTFACYYAPDRIELCADNAQEVQGLLQAAGLEERLGSVDVLDMLLAHELFHVVQQWEPDLYVNQKHILLRKLGRLRQESRLVSLEEVAAMAFARELLGMAVTPYVYDVWMLLPRAPERAQALYRQLMELREEVCGQ